MTNLIVDCTSRAFGDSSIRAVRAINRGHTTRNERMAFLFHGGLNPVFPCGTICPGSHGHAVWMTNSGRLGEPNMNCPARFEPEERNAP